ncbi:hypothetical protein ACWD4J_13255 [Streptomyces sp. NPDC002577]
MPARVLETATLLTGSNDKDGIAHAVTALLGCDDGRSDDAGRTGSGSHSVALADNLIRSW